MCWKLQFIIIIVVVAVVAVVAAPAAPAVNIIMWLQIEFILHYATRWQYLNRQPKILTQSAQVKRAQKHSD